MNDDDQRQLPPCNLDAERGILGLLLVNNDALFDIADIVQPQDFYRPAHQMVYQAMMSMSEERIPYDPVTIIEYLGPKGELAGGAVFLFNLVQASVVGSSAVHYAQIIRDKAVLRRLAEAGIRINQAANSADGDDVADVLALAEKEVQAAGDMSDGGTDGFVSLDELAETAIQDIRDNANAATGAVLSGFERLDEITTGFRPGEMIIIAGRPGSGKSTLAVDIARHASIRCGLTGVFFSLEMNRKELNQRLLSAESGVRFKKIRQGQMTAEEWNELEAAVDSVKGTPLYFHDDPYVTTMKMLTVSRKWKQRWGLDYVILDYLQLVKSTSKTRAESRQQEVSDMSRNVKLMAKELDVPVIILAQLNRGPEGRIDRKPQVSDLRESGSLEQDADMVILVHRPDSADPDDRPGEADFIVGKNRSGPSGVCTVTHQLHVSRFRDFSAA